METVIVLCASFNICNCQIYQNIVHINVLFYIIYYILAVHWYSMYLWYHQMDPELRLLFVWSFTFPLCSWYFLFTRFLFSRSSSIFLLHKNIPVCGFGYAKFALGVNESVHACLHGAPTVSLIVSRFTLTLTSIKHLLVINECMPDSLSIS